MRTIAIVGGGFSGTMTAVNLARLAKSPLRVVLLNKGSPLGRGVAYGTKQPEHLLNVVARNMSAFPDQPNHFLEWLGTRSEYADKPEAELRDQFMPRRTYGDYLQSLLFWYSKGAANPKAKIETIDNEVLDLVPGADGVAVVVSGHPTIEADKVVLATGNPPPAELPFATNFEHPRFLANPWKSVDYAKEDPRQNVILIGAGLTMIDVFLTLTSLNWQGTLYAVSRTGLMPQSHFQGIVYPDFPPADPMTLGFDGLLKLMEHHCQLLRDRGENPAIVVDKLRPFTQKVWQAFSVADKARFLRDYRTRWNTIRHRVAQSIYEQVAAALKSGKLQIVAGKICSLTASGDRLQLTVEKKSTERQILEAGWVLNCTGPLESYKNTKSSLYENLFDRGLVQADDMDMGIKATSDFAVVDGGGYVSKNLYAIGPMLKGTLWETTAVPELRIQALRVAETILAALEGGAEPGWFAEMWVDIVEYDI